MKTILIPTDFSECANNAMRFAAFIANKTDANIILLHILDIPSIGPQGSIDGTIDDIPYMMDLLNATKKRMNNLVSFPFMKHIKVDQKVEIGNISNGIIKSAAQLKPDLIIMGTHGTEGFREIIGSTAEKIIHNVHVPVITIKDKITTLKIEKIVFATDLSEEFEMVFPKVESFAKLFNAKIELVKVITKNEFETTENTQQRINQIKKQFSKSNFGITIYNDYNKQNGIKKFAIASNADIIVVGTHGKHGWAGLFNVSGIADEMVNHFQLPVMAINLEHLESPTIKTSINYSTA